MTLAKRLLRSASPPSSSTGREKPAIRVAKVAPNSASIWRSSSLGSPKTVKWRRSTQAENLALNVIAKAGHGGSYIELDHTFENMRDTALMPNIATRDMRSNWEEAGRLNANTRALQEASKILTRDNPAKFSDEVDTLIRKRFKGLVNGDAQLASINGN